MEFLFYMWAIVAILYEAIVMVNPKDATRHINDLKNRNKNKLEQSENQKLFNIFQFLYMVWVLVGLFTTYWVVFLFFLIFSYSTSLLMKKTYTDFDQQVMIRGVDAVISFLILLFIVINKYHLHIPSSDILNFIRSLFSIPGL